MSLSLSLGLGLSLSLICLAATAFAWDDDCGYSKFEDAGRDQGRRNAIVGGWEARENEFPYQATLLAGGYFLCGAVLINSEWVLGAAHCMFRDGDPTFYKIVLGEHIRDSDAQFRNVLDIDDYIMHEKFGATGGYGWDIALVHLSSPISFNDSQYPACRPKAADYTNLNTTVSGWGSTVSGGDPTDELRYVNVPVYSDAGCRAAYEPGEVDETMICAGEKDEKDSCQGDSGGPLAFKREDGKFELVGLVSWGKGCASGYPGVYADVPFFLDWIDETMGSYRKRPRKSIL